MRMEEKISKLNKLQGLLNPQVNKSVDQPVSNQLADTPKVVTTEPGQQFINVPKPVAKKPIPIQQKIEQKHIKSMRI